jgi:hypothetical protein
MKQSLIKATKLITNYIMNCNGKCLKCPLYGYDILTEDKKPEALCDIFVQLPLRSRRFVLDFGIGARPNRSKEKWDEIGTGVEAVEMDRKERHGKEADDEKKA